VGDHLTPSTPVPAQETPVNALVVDEPVELTEEEKELFDDSEDEEVVKK